MSMHVGPSMPACFASPDALARASHGVFFCVLDRRVSTASNESGRPKSEQSPPTVAPIDLAAGGTVTGGVGGEEGQKRRMLHALRKQEPHCYTRSTAHQVIDWGAHTTARFF